MENAKFYHGGSTICLSAEARIVDLINESKYALESINIGIYKNKITEAESLGVKSVPALVLGNEVLHINFAASIEDLKKG